MSARMRSHVRSNVIGYLALFVALGGTTYAAATVGPADIEEDAVRTKHILNGQVRTPDLNGNAVTGLNINPNAFVASDIARSGGQYQIPDLAIQNNELDFDSVRSPEIDNGTVMGVDLEEGAVGARELDAPLYRRSAEVAHPGGGGVVGKTVGCDPGDAMISGGARIPTAGFGSAIVASFGLPFFDAWRAQATSSDPATLIVEVYCLPF